jgi:hypothetical protein
MFDSDDNSAGIQTQSSQGELEMDVDEDGAGGAVGRGGIEGGNFTDREDSGGDDNDGFAAGRAEDSDGFVNRNSRARGGDDSGGECQNLEW